MIQRIRKDFPFFKNNKELIYFDNAATTQKPQQVIDAMTAFYEHDNAPVHRGVYTLAERSTQIYEDARTMVTQFIGAHDDELIFTKGTTEAINLIATSWAAKQLKAGDEIIITELEHHSNCVPWIRLEKNLGIVLNYIPILADGTLDYDAYLTLLTPRTKLVACTHTSNAIGTRVDLQRIIEPAHAVGARVLVDAAQAAGRTALNVRELKADFLAFSAHKMFGPTGIGALFIARHMHEEVEPYQVGGGMVYSVDFHDVSWAKSPQKYEAGTPLIAQAVGFAAAVRYSKETISFDDLKQHEAQLCAKLIKGLKTVPGITILGPVDELAASGHLVSFVSNKMHPHDVAAYLDQQGICVRAGNHCAQPLHKKLGIEGSVRVSFCATNQESEVDKLINALKQL